MKPPIVIEFDDDNVEHHAEATICECVGWALAVLATRGGVLQWELVCERWIAGPHGFAPQPEWREGRRW